MSDNGSVTLNVEHHIATINFQHPRGNSLPGMLLEDLSRTITEAGGDPESRTIILKSSGSRAFCAGASLDELASVSTLQEGKSFFMGFAKVLNAMRTCPKFIIARVHGRAVGGGVGLVAAADYCLAHSSSEIRLSELSLGLGPYVISPAVIRKAGLSAFASLSMNAGRWFDAEWAESKGLFNQVCNSQKKLDAAVSRLSGELALANPDSMYELKKVMWQNTDHWKTTLSEMAGISGKMLLSDTAQARLKKYIKESKKRV